MLGTTRAQNIQIEVKRLPAARHIRNAILNMDKMFFNKEMIEVLVQYICRYQCVSGGVCISNVIPED